MLEYSLDSFYTAKRPVTPLNSKLIVLGWIMDILSDGFYATRELRETDNLIFSGHSFHSEPAYNFDLFFTKTLIHIVFERRTMINHAIK